MKDNIKVPFIFWFSWVEKTIEGFHSENFDVESFRISVSQEKFKKLGFMYWFIRIFLGTTRNYIIKHKNNKLSIFWYRYCFIFLSLFLNAMVICICCLSIRKQKSWIDTNVNILQRLNYNTVLNVKNEISIKTNIFFE